MSFTTGELTIGIEEEYLLVNRQTRELAVDPPPGLIDECRQHTGGLVSSELQRSQIEIGTRVCSNVRELREDLIRMRRGVVEVTARHGLAPIAASTHPFSRWSDQKQTQNPRYELLTREMQALVRRMVICGMHVHVGIADPELRIDLMNQLPYFLPQLLALSCSSPFWGGHDTGYRSYRLTIFDVLPRTGIPQHFNSYAEYQRHVDVLVNAGLIEDSSKIWWDLRPSNKYPTLETRIMDVCTLADDAVALASALLCILRMLWRLRVANQRWRLYSPMLVQENRWRAMRYGTDQGLLDMGRGELVAHPQLMQELLSLIEDDAAALGCSAEVASLPQILARGTSAHRQLRAYASAKAAGATKREALKQVVDLLIAETASAS